MQADECRIYAYDIEKASVFGKVMRHYMRIHKAIEHLSEDLVWSHCIQFGDLGFAYPSIIAISVKS